MKEPLFYAKAACDTIMRKYEAGDLPPKDHFHYHQGVFLSGMYRTYLRCGDSRYIQYIREWVDSCMDENGEFHIFDKGQLDDIQPGILLFPLLDRSDDMRYRQVLDRLFSIVKEFPRNEEGGFWHKEYRPNQMWLDGLYMAGPFCAEYGYRFNRPECFDLVAEQALLMQKKTRDEKTGLWRHAWDCSKMEKWADPDTGLSPEFWGRSIGWVPVAVLDELDFIPLTHPDYQKLQELVKDLLEAVCRYQSEDGRWYQVVDKGGEPGNWLETSCTCLFAAAICKAVEKRILPECYILQARKAYDAVIRSLKWKEEDLLVGNVCIGTGVGDYAYYCRRPVSENDLHGVGAFLLMCMEMQQYADNHKD